MSTLKILTTAEKLKGFTYLCRNIMHIKSYSVNNNKHSNMFCNLKKCTINKKEVSKTDPTSCIEVENKKDNCEVPCIANTKKTPLNFKEKGTLSLAIIGGGWSSISATILLKQHPSIKKICLIDTDDSLAGPVCDLRQIDTSTSVKLYKRKSILDGLRHADIVAIMDETQFSLGNKGPFSQFVSSAYYVKSVAECTMNACPKALVAVFAHPVTATLPLVSEIYKQSGHWDPNKIIGSAALESMRIAAMTATLLDLNPSFLHIPIAGGVDSMTAVPLLSTTKLFNSFNLQDQFMLIHQLRSADNNLYKSEIRGPNLSSGVAAAKFISTLINGLKGQSIAIASAYVRSDVLPPCKYMSNEIQFGPKGVYKNLGLPKASPSEISLIEQAAPIINQIVHTVTDFINTGKIK